ncbi:MAG: L-rhamnose isomerase [Sphaerochaetaceae bacterium]|nr:L-rhamnose isomerase [Spirochaetaceae bacterium]MDY6343373.1 L-rhamnose isomerase [Sphaerochaetaceae bacterium]
MSRYSEARETYAGLGVDTELALKQLASIPVSLHCWQGDDVRGFENGGADLSGGIQTTGNYPGRARNPGELMEDLSFALQEIPGSRRLNLHASYLVTQKPVERNQIEPEHYQAWVDFAKEHHLGLDFNPTFFSSPMVKDNLTLSSPDGNVRRYWIEHGKRCRRVAESFAGQLGGHSLCNVWIPDGYKDVPADRLGPRLRLKESLDQIFEEEMPHVIDSVESKTFGIGLESFTVGSNEFYAYYAARHPGVYQLMDTGHYHPTEMVSEKLSALLCYAKYVPLHVSRPVRWDSDHVVTLTDELKELAKEIVRAKATDRVLIGLDFFDASINRIAAWIIGARNMQKALLIALLEPGNAMEEMQDGCRFTRLLACQEELKTLDWGAVWEEFLARAGMDGSLSWLSKVEDYEKQVLAKRR